MLGKQAQQRTQIGLHIAANGLAVAEIDLSADNRTTLKSCAYFPAQESSERLKLLESYIRKHDLKKQQCIVTLDEAHYNLFQIPAPPVEDTELSSAIRWSVKDLIDYPLDDAVVEVFRIPVQQFREAKVYAVVAPRSDIQQTVDFVRKTGLTLETIDIEELSLGNVIEQMEGQDRGIAVLHIGQHHGAISLYKDSALYLSRRVDIGLERMESLQEQNTSPENMAAQIYEPIILELQRSLDFYESEFAQPPITRLVIAPRHPVLQSFCDYVSNHSGLAIEFLNLAQIYTDSTELNDENQTSCLLAIAAASRKQEVPE